MSLSTASSHLFLGLPAGLLPPNSFFRIFNGIRSFSIRITCPIHCSLFNLMVVDIHESLNESYISLLYLCLQVPFSFIGPKMRLRIFLSKEFRAFSSFLLRVQLSQPYINVGLIWKTYPGQKLARKLVLGPNSSLSRSLLKLGKVGIRRAVALITEHGHFRKHLHRVGIYKDDPICRMCKQEEETASHILFDCPFLERKRFALFTTREELEGDTDIGTKILQLVKGTDFGR